MTTTTPQRIGGWLLGPLAWLLVALLSTLISVLLAVKAFAFSPVEDGIAVRQLLFTLLATALIVPYFKRSSRVKATFVNP